MTAGHSARLMGALGAFVFTLPASAVYTGINFEWAPVVADGQNYWRFRLYAYFTDPNDYLTGVSGSPTLGALRLETRNATDTGAGTNFFNPGGAGSNTAPYQESIDLNPALANGTFATIGVPIADMGSGPDGTDETATSPGFPNFIAGNQLINDNIGWFTAGPMEQGRAGYAGDGDPSNRVLFAQLTTNVGEWIRGTVNIYGVNGETGSSFALAQQYFLWIPGPAGLALLAVAGAFGRRRARA